MNNSTAPITVIEPKKGWVPIDFKEIWEYRELLYFLTKRDIKVRYKQTVLGGLWAIIQPAFTMVIFTLFFGRLAKMPSDGMPYPIFVYVGLLPWTYFANAVSGSGNSLVGSANLITKIYFPRLIVPASASLAGLLDFFVSMFVLGILMIHYSFVPSIGGLFLFPFLFLVLFCRFVFRIYSIFFSFFFRWYRFVAPHQQHFTALIQQCMRFCFDGGKRLTCRPFDFADDAYREIRWKGITQT